MRFKSKTAKAKEARSPNLHIIIHHSPFQRWAGPQIRKSANPQIREAPFAPKGCAWTEAD
eukprot:scaffold7558_cov277-Pinguiococcus_pyrenoidosus.AAC.1